MQQAGFQQPMMQQPMLPQMMQGGYAMQPQQMMQVRHFLSLYLFLSLSATHSACSATAWNDAGLIDRVCCLLLAHWPLTVLSCQPGMMMQQPGTPHWRLLWSANLLTRCRQA